MRRGLGLNWLVKMTDNLKLHLVIKCLHLCLECGILEMNTISIIDI